MNRIICFFLGHKWLMVYNLYPRKVRRCERCNKKQTWQIKFNRLDVYEGWL